MIGGLLGGCGYTLSHRLNPAFTGGRPIFVPVFENQTNEVGAEKVFTNALIRELKSRGNIEIQDSRDGALELYGVITGLTYGATIYTEPGFKGLQPYRNLPSELGMTANITVYLRKEGQTIWSKGFSAFRRVEAPTDRTYDFQAPSAAPLITQSIAEGLYASIARDLTRDIYDEMVDLF